MAEGLPEGQSVTGEAQAVEWLGSNPVDGKKLVCHAIGGLRAVSEL